MTHPRGSRTENAAVIVAAGAWSIVRIVRFGFLLFGLFVIGFGLWGYQHAHTPAFKLECAAYQEHIVSMSFPDNMLCIMFWQIS